MGYNDAYASQQYAQQVTAAATAAQAIAEKAIAAATAGTANAPTNQFQKSSQEKLVAAANDAIAAYNTAAATAKEWSAFSVDWFGKGTGDQSKIYQPLSMTSSADVKALAVYVVSQYYSGTGANRVQITVYSDGTTTSTPAPETVSTTPDTTTTSKQESDRQSIITILTDRFKKYGLESLASKIKELAIDGATESTITIGLQDTEEYKMRFSANQDRIKKGLAVLTPGDYITLEDTYRQVLRAYGLKQFDNDAYVKQFISNDVSPTELSNRVSAAVQRVQNADPAVQQQLRNYYGIDSNSMVAYVLDPEQQFQKIQRQIAAAEIGVAAGRQGLQAGVGVAEQLAAQGITQAEAQKGYSTIADVLPTAEKLTEIYGGRAGTYNQSTAEQEVFNSLASAQRARQKLSATEIGSFSGQSGASTGAFSTGYLNRQSSAGQF
jgi:hypothetical protein